MKQKEGYIQIKVETKAIENRKKKEQKKKEIKNWFFVKINKINKLLKRQIRKRKGTS